jgi:hypothetical protein
LFTVFIIIIVFLYLLVSTSQKPTNHSYNDNILVKHGLIDQDLYFGIFNPTPFWNKPKPIVEGMRSKRSDPFYENFESLNSKRLSWR